MATKYTRPGQPRPTQARALGIQAETITARPPKPLPPRPVGRPPKPGSEAALFQSLMRAGEAVEECRLSLLGTKPGTLARRHGLDALAAAMTRNELALVPALQKISLGALSNAELQERAANLAKDMPTPQFAAYLQLSYTAAYRIQHGTYNATLYSKTKHALVRFIIKQEGPDPYV